VAGTFTGSVRQPAAFHRRHSEKQDSPYVGSNELKIRTALYSTLLLHIAVVTKAKNFVYNIKRNFRLEHQTTN